MPSISDGVVVIVFLKAARDESVSCGLICNRLLHINMVIQHDSYQKVYYNIIVGFSISQYCCCDNDFLYKEVTTK